jgi:GTP-binding protein
MFVDEAAIYAKAGDGGKGCVSFYKDKYSRYRKPDGGNGGKGGDIIIKADYNISTLMDFQYRQHFEGQRGGLGGSNNKQGSIGKDCIIKVPPGTLVYDMESGLLMRDLTQVDEEVIVCRGGMGGHGNYSKREPTPPQDGEKKKIKFVLKLIADLGLVGYPNAGKSSLISKISDAHPKIADYPFTTKAPNLGVVRLGNEHVLVAADIPGLIEGAHKGKGLGLKFLRHIERTKFLLHIVDMAGVDGRNPLDDYTSLNFELKQYEHGLGQKPQIVVANKMDLPEAKANLAEFKKKVKEKIFPISAKTGLGIKELILEINNLLGIKD